MVQPIGGVLGVALLRAGQVDRRGGGGG
jgi:hypothetical protein